MGLETRRVWKCEGCSRSTEAVDQNEGFNGDPKPDWGPPSTWPGGKCRRCRRKEAEEEVKRLGGTVLWEQKV